MFATENLKEVNSAFAQHRNAVQKALHEYREAVAQYDSRYAPDYAKQKIAEAKATAGYKVKQADGIMHDAIMSIAKNIRHGVRSVVTAKPSDGFSSVMKEYKRYGLKMTEFEVRAFAEQAAGSYMELRILQSIAENSGFRVSIPSVSDIEADIKRIERGAWLPSMYTPLEYVKEAAEIFGEIPQFRADGSVWDRRNKADAVYLATVNHTRERLEADLENAIPERWSNMGAINVEPIADNMPEGDKDKDADANRERTAAERAEAETDGKRFAEGLPITLRDDPNAAAIMAQNEAAARQSREVLAKYIKR